MRAWIDLPAHASWTAGERRRFAAHVTTLQSADAELPPLGIAAAEITRNPSLAAAELVLHDLAVQGWAIRAGRRAMAEVSAPPIESDAAVAGADVIYRACSRTCERLLNKVLPKAIREASLLLSRQSQSTTRT